MVPKNTNFIKQVLITGCYRSGTEYFSLLLSNNKEIAVTMYTTSFMRYSFNKYNNIALKKNYLALLNEAKQRIKKRWKMNLDIEIIIQNCKKKKITYAILYDQIMKNLFIKDSKKHVWAEKTQLVWREIPEFLKMFPKGKAIIVLRDPRSVLASFKKYTFNPEPAYLGAIFNCYDVMQNSLNYKKKYPSKVLIIKYEELVLNPKKIIKKTLNFLNIKKNIISVSQKDWKNAYGLNWNNNSAFQNQKQKTFNIEQSIYRWRQNLNKNDVRFCEYINKTFMKKFDYKFSNYKNNFDVIFKKINNNKKLKKYFLKWKNSSTGVQEFPNDPLDPKNWEENN